MATVARSSWHGGVAMDVEITVYDVPESVRDRLVEHAASRSQSLEEYLRQELERMAATPSVASLVEEIRHREEAAARRSQRRRSSLRASLTRVGSDSTDRRLGTDTSAGLRCRPVRRSRSGQPWGT